MAAYHRIYKPEACRFPLLRKAVDCAVDHRGGDAEMTIATLK
jgi:hypothetical protein